MKNKRIWINLLKVLGLLLGLLLFGYLCHCFYYA